MLCNCELVNHVFSQEAPSDTKLGFPFAGLVFIISTFHVELPILVSLGYVSLGSVRSYFSVVF